MVYSSHDVDYSELHLLWIFPCNSYCDERGQASRAVTGIEIQTYSNFKTSSLSCCLLPACQYCNWFYIFLMFSRLCQQRRICCGYKFIVPVGLLSRQNLLQTTTASSPSTISTCWTWTSKRRRNSNEHWAIQKDCLHHSLGTVSIGVLLFLNVHFFDTLNRGSLVQSGINF